MRIAGETNDLSRMTTQSWIERLLELTAAHELKNIGDVNELGLFLKTYWK